MNGVKVLGAVVATILVSSLGTLVACSAPAEKENVATSKSVAAASVQIGLYDANGTRVGDAEGVLIAPRLVLTAAHAISGKDHWQVVSADGKQTTTGSRGMTYDWMQYDSSKAHPRLHDVGVIHLDAPIKLDSYPQLSANVAASGLDATRAKGTGASYTTMPAKLSKVLSAPHAWLTDMPGGETLQTGSAVFDDKGIVGVVSGRGLTTGKLYVAQVAGLHDWLSEKVSCATPAGNRNYAGPATDKSVSTCEDGGAGASSSGASSSGASSSGASGSPGTSSGAPGASGGDDDDDKSGSCSHNKKGHCHGKACGKHKGQGNGGANGTQPNGGGGDDDDDDSVSNGGAGGSSSGSSGANGSNPNGGDNGDVGSSGSGSNGGATSSSGSSGANGSNPNGGGDNGNQTSSSGQSSGETPNQGGNSGPGTSSSGGGGGDTEVCSGESDNPETCPPEAKGCKGPSCGGGSPDMDIDYGNCSCSSSKGSEDDLDVR